MFDKLKLFLKSAETETSPESEAKEIGFDGPMDQFRKGMEVEKEHGPSGPEHGKFNMTDGDSEAEALIAAAHISEIPDYYDKLEEMEKDSFSKVSAFLEPSYKIDRYKDSIQKAVYDLEKQKRIFDKNPGYQAVPSDMPPQFAFDAAKNVFNTHGSRMPFLEAVNKEMDYAKDMNDYADTMGSIGDALTPVAHPIDHANAALDNLWETPLGKYLVGDGQANGSIADKYAPVFSNQPSSNPEVTYSRSDDESNPGNAAAVSLGMKLSSVQDAELKSLLANFSKTLQNNLKQDETNNFVKKLVI
jgi:hypothetical protein